ncbi:hypothetical protein MIND_00840500 [Mycena indigotica]|uniref:Uncharacterized protein n=1 Tax=Mycena indigotica TaxID=2126181 RepID=A0A8H6SG15_9AGAR|nr:uncharacterized protein MIND_00840500 [Mycena indigotica]KAF7298925.1 hypothetical protein MIND_00840500 [Mycena indigotica]
MTTATFPAQELCVALAASSGDAQYPFSRASWLLSVDPVQAHRDNGVSFANRISKILIPVLEAAQKGRLPARNSELQKLFLSMDRTVGLMHAFVEIPPHFTPKRIWDSKRLTKQLQKNCKAIMKIATSNPTAKSNTGTIFEAAKLSTQIAVAVCDVPVLNAFKPIPNLVALILDKAQIAKANKDAAVALAQHAENVSKSLLEQAVSGEPPADALQVLHGAVEEAVLLLDDLSQRRKYTSWFYAAPDGARFASINAKLDKALAVYAARETVKMNIILRNVQETTYQSIRITLFF